MRPYEPHKIVLTELRVVRTVKVLLTAMIQSYVYVWIKRMQNTAPERDAVQLYKGSRE